jgi:hypothetical protein
VRFAPESLQRIGAFYKSIRQEFQGYVALETQVFRFVHNAHASGAQLVQYPVMRNGLPNQWATSRG